MVDAKETEISLKVVIDRHKKKVVFAEASSDIVDILFGFLTLPMGTIVRNLAKHSDPPVNIGSFNNLYGSVANLDTIYFDTVESKDMLLHTRNSAEAQCRNLKINIDDMKSFQYFVCEGGCFTYLSTYSTLKCKNCGKFLKRVISFDANACRGNEGVFVAKTSSFVITDDLHVFPNNPASALGILEGNGIKDFAVLEENTLKLGSNEILHLLECSFTSKTPLSDLFFGTKWMNSQVPVIQSPIYEESTEDSEKMRIKVFVQKSTNKILLANSAEDFIDFLFSLLTIPLGKVISLLTKDHDTTLSIENIHKSVLELNVDEYLKSQQLKDMLLGPKLLLHYLCPNHIFPLKEETNSNIFLKVGTSPYGGSIYYLSFDSTSALREFTYQSPKNEGGFVRGPTKFMVTDDLVVSPLSAMSCFTYIHRLKVPPSDIEEQVIDIGKKEALNLLKASLTSTSVLSNGLKFSIVKFPKQETSPIKPKSERL